MDIQTARIKFRGFTTWHNNLVPRKYRFKKDKLWFLYAKELIENNCVILDAKSTITGKKEIWK